MAADLLHDDVQSGKSDQKRMDPDYFDQFIFGRISAYAGLPNIRFHDLRHFFAPMLIAQGESANTSATR